MIITFPYDAPECVSKLLIANSSSLESFGLYIMHIMCYIVIASRVHCIAIEEEYAIIEPLVPNMYRKINDLTTVDYHFKNFLSIKMPINQVRGSVNE